VLPNAQQASLALQKEYVFQMIKDKELNIWQTRQSQEDMIIQDLRELFYVHSLWPSPAD
jgi:hypothetical protein